MERFVIEKLIYVKAEEYKPVYNRPFVVSVTGEDVDKLINTLEDAGTSTIDSGIIVSSGVNILQHDPRGYMTNIDHSWVGNRRFIFMLKLSYTDTLGVVNNIYVIGFTEYDGISHSGHIDPAMVHYINSVIETQVFTINNPYTGVVYEERIKNIYNTINNFKSNIDNVFLQRPSDVISNLETLNVYSYMNEYNDHVYQLHNMKNTLNSMQNRAVKSDVEYNIGTRYLSKVLTATINNHVESELNYNDDFYNPMTNKKTLVDGGLRTNPFINFINNVENNIGVSNMFRFNTLKAIQPNVEDIAVCIDPVYNNHTLFSNTPSEGDYWESIDTVTIKAYSLIEQFIAMVTRYGFTKLYFEITNKTDQFMTPIMTIQDFNSFINMLSEASLQRVLEAVKTNIINEIFIPATYGNTVPMYVSAYIDITFTSKIYLEIEGFYGNWYTIPTFANSMFSPVVTVDKEQLDNTTVAVEGLSSSIFQRLKY